MATYSKEFKDKLLQLLMPPDNKPVKEVVEEYKIHEQTLYRWIKEAKLGGAQFQEDTSNKQKYSKEMQLQIIIETSQMNNHDVSEYCRRKGIFIEEIEAWKKAFINGETNNQMQLKHELKLKDAELKQTKKELDRKEKALAEAAALLVLGKKMQAIWNSDEEN